MQEFHIEISLEQSPAAMTAPITNQAPVVPQDRDSSTHPVEYYNPKKSPYEFAKMIRSHSINDGIELDLRFHSRSEDHSRTYRFTRKRRHDGSNSLTTREQLDGPC